MKKLIGLLAATGLIAGAGATAVSCGCGNKKESAEFKALKNVSIHLNENDSKDIDKVISEVKKQLEANNNIKNATVTKNKPGKDKKSEKPNEYLVYVSMSDDKTKAILELFYAKDKGDNFKSQGNHTIETKTTESNKFDLKLLDVKLMVGMAKKDAEKAIKDAINSQSGVNIADTNYTLDSQNVSDPLKKDEKFIIKTNQSAKLIKGQKEITVLDSTNEKQELSKVITNKALGEIADNKEATILVALKSKNSTLDTSQLEVKDIKENGAKIVAKQDSKNYKGDVDVTYTIKQSQDQEKQELSKVITNKALGEIADNKEATILVALKNKNSTLDTNQLEVKDIKENGAKIVAKQDSKNYKGDVDVTYTTKKK